MNGENSTVHGQTTIMVLDPDDGTHEVWVTDGEANCQDCGAHGPAIPNAQQWHDNMRDLND